MKRFASLLVLSLCLPLVARADEASHKAKAEEMITILHMDRMVEGVMQNAMRQTTALTAQHYGGSIPPNGAAALADFQKRLSAVLEPELGWNAMKPEYVNLFVTDFPEDQLDAMLAFYKSPAGVAMLQKLPDIEQQVGKVLQGKVQKLQPQVASMFQEYQKSLPPAQAAPPASSTTPATPQKSTPK